MKISIITPTYNSARTIARTIDSVLSQNYPDLEYIIIDGNSTDGTQKIVNEYQEDFRNLKRSYKGQISIKLVSEPDKGIYDAMNKGIKMATGEIIGIINSDDFYDNNEVLNLVALNFEDRNIDAVYGDLKYFTDDINKTSRYWRAGNYSNWKFNNGWAIPHPTLFVRNSIYQKCGLFNTDFKIAADYEFILRILKTEKIKIKYLPKTFVRMYAGGASGKNIGQRRLGWQESRKAWEINNLKLPRFYTFRRVLFKIRQFIFK